MQEKCAVVPTMNDMEYARTVAPVESSLHTRPEARGVAQSTQKRR